MWPSVARPAPDGTVGHSYEGVQEPVAGRICPERFGEELGCRKAVSDIEGSYLQHVRAIHLRPWPTPPVGARAWPLPQPNTSHRRNYIMEPKLQ